jgi:hypothetical protein
MTAHLYLYNYFISVFRQGEVELGGQVQLELFPLFPVDAKLGLDAIAPIFSNSFAYRNSHSARSYRPENQARYCRYFSKRSRIEHHLVYNLYY